MSVDIKREIRAYAAYLDEILPTVTADDVRTATVPTPLGPSRTNRSEPSWYRSPVTAFAAAVMVVIVVMVPVLVFPLSGDIDSANTVPAVESSVTPATISVSNTASTPIASLGDTGLRWVETKLSPSDARAFDENWYGYDVAVDGDRIVIGSPIKYEGIMYGGAVYVYEPDGSGGWVETKLTASDGANAGQFGMSVAVDGDTVVVGSPFEMDSEGPAETHGSQGAAYVYEPDGSGGWVETKLTASDGADLDEFGSSVAVSGDRIVVGAGGDDEYSGAVYVFERDAQGGWLETKLTASDGAPFGYFGYRASLGLGVPVAVEGDRIAVGSSSAVYLFEPDGNGGWVETRLAVSAYGVAIDGDRLVIGSGSGVFAYERDGTGEWAATDLATPAQGRWLDVSDDRIAVSVDASVVPRPGLVYVVEGNGEDDWIETVLMSSDSNPMDDGRWSYHDWVVAVDGDRVVVGAPNAFTTGVAYVYEWISD
jgi:hypothetical protein